MNCQSLVFFMTDIYAYPLCIQLNADVIYSVRFPKVLELLQVKHFYGVELNLLNFDDAEFDKISSLLKNYDLILTSIASGAFADQYGLSLSDADDARRQNTVNMLKQKVIPFAERFHANIICGFIKGKAGDNLPNAKSQMEKSLSELAHLCEYSGIHLYLEATNHYEATLINLVEEGAAFMCPGVRVLPDTYHMNIEEANMFKTMLVWRELYSNIHISDNNRYYPGFGSIDFLKVIQTLRDMSYSGTLTIEGRNRYEIEADIKESADYLAKVSAS